jgi:PIN domain nuclease of toxin-antitoxin system
MYRTSFFKANLGWHHGVPFDRLLITQAQDMDVT